MTASDATWREEILTKLRHRNLLENRNFGELIAQHNRIFDTVNTLKHENLQLSIQIEKLRTEGGSYLGGGGGSGTSSSDSRLQEKLHSLEQKLLVQQEELTELHRRKGENAQQIIDLNNKLQEKERLLVHKDIVLAENAATIASLKAEISMFTKNHQELKRLNDNLRDEYQALQLAFTSLEAKLRTCQDENTQMVERLIKYKVKDADRMNEENDNFLKRMIEKDPLPDAPKASDILKMKRSAVEENCKFGIVFTVDHFT